LAVFVCVVVGRAAREVGFSGKVRCVGFSLFGIIGVWFVFSVLCIFVLKTAWAERPRSVSVGVGSDEKVVRSADGSTLVRTPLGTLGAGPPPPRKFHVHGIGDLGSAVGKFGGQRKAVRVGCYCTRRRPSRPRQAAREACANRTASRCAGLKVIFPSQGGRGRDPVDRGPTSPTA